MTDFAIVQTGGKQYRVCAGDTIRVESLPGDTGDTITLHDVLAVSLNDEVKVGSPNVPGAEVDAEIVGSGKGKKVIVFKYKSKTRYRRKNGHRQQYTDLRVTKISLD